MITALENANHRATWLQTEEWSWLSERTGLFWRIRKESENRYCARVMPIHDRSAIAAKGEERLVYISAAGKWLANNKDPKNARQRSWWRTVQSAREACEALDKNEPAIHVATKLTPSLVKKVSP